MDTEIAWKEFKATLTPFEKSLERVAGLDWYKTCMVCDLDQHPDDVEKAEVEFKEALAAHSLAFNRDIADYQTDFDNHEVKCDNARRTIAAAAIRSNPQPLRLVAA
jgi:hypothetical protein